MTLSGFDYDEIAGQLRGLLIQVSGEFSTSQVEEVEEFVDHGEFGEALHSLAWYLVECRTRFDDVVLAGIDSLSTRMKMRQEIPLDRLAELAARGG